MRGERKGKTARRKKEKMEKMERTRRKKERKKRKEKKKTLNKPNPTQKAISIPSSFTPNQPFSFEQTLL